MRKRICLPAFLCCIAILISSCITTKDLERYSGYFREGDFIGDKIHYDENQNREILEEGYALLNVKSITKEEFDSAKGVDVVKDINGGDNPYFLLTLRIKNSLDNYESYHFYDLFLQSGTTYWYKDNNSKAITPALKNGDINSLYIIEGFKDDNLSFNLVFTWRN